MIIFPQKERLIDIEKEEVASALTCVRHCITILIVSKKTIDIAIETLVIEPDREEHIQKHNEFTLEGGGKDD